MSRPKRALNTSNVVLLLLLVVNICFLAWNFSLSRSLAEAQVPRVTTIRAPHLTRPSTAATPSSRAAYEPIGRVAPHPACHCSSAHFPPAVSLPSVPSCEPAPTPGQDHLQVRGLSEQDAKALVSLPLAGPSVQQPPPQVHMLLPLTPPFTATPPRPAASQTPVLSLSLALRQATRGHGACSERRMAVHSASALGAAPAAAALLLDMTLRLGALAQQGVQQMPPTISAHVPPKRWKGNAVPDVLRGDIVDVPLSSEQRPQGSALLPQNSSQIQPLVLCDVDENLAAHGWRTVLDTFVSLAPRVQVTAPVVLQSLHSWLPHAMPAVSRGLHAPAAATWTGYASAAARLTAPTAPLAAMDSWDMALGAVFELHERSKALRQRHRQALRMPVLHMQLLREGGGHRDWLLEALGVRRGDGAAPPPLHMPPPPAPPSVNRIAPPPRNYTLYRLHRHLAEMHALYRPQGAHELPPSLLSDAELLRCATSAARETGLQGLPEGKLPAFTQLATTVQPNSTVAVQACLRRDAVQGATAVFPAAGSVFNRTVVAPSTAETQAAQTATLQDAQGAFSCRWAQCVAWGVAQAYSVSRVQERSAALASSVGCWRLAEGEGTVPDLMQSAVEWVDTVLSLQEDDFELDDAEAYKALFMAVKGGKGGSNLHSIQADATAANVGGSGAAADGMRKLCRAVLPAGRLPVLRAEQPMGKGGPGLLRSKSGAPILIEGLEGVDRMAFARYMLQAAGVQPVLSPGARRPSRMPLPAAPHEGGAGPPSRRVMLDIQKMCKAAELPLCLRSYVMHASPV